MAFCKDDSDGPYWNYFLVLKELELLGAPCRVAPVPLDSILGQEDTRKAKQEHLLPLPRTELQSKNEGRLLFSFSLQF